MELWQAVILGLVEGVTEFLPVSSTGHLIIASALLGLDDPEIKGAVDVFNIVIQGGAILAVLGLYWPRVLKMIRGLLGRDAAGLRLAKNIIIAFLPAAVLGVLLNDIIEETLFHPLPVLTALFLGGVWMIWLGRGKRHRVNVERSRSASGEAPERAQITLDDMTWRTALLIGLFQTLAMWPGTSRSMMTIAGGTLLGLKPKEAAEFSFLLGLPTLGGACVYRLVKDYARDDGQPGMFETLGVAPVVVGILVAAISAALAVRWLVAFLNKHGLAAFGWYRIALCVVLGALIFGGVVQFR